MSTPLSQADLIFPNTLSHPSLSSTLSSLRRSTLSLHNRLTSIVHDSTFVTAVSTAYALPLLANERCGSWYIPPSAKAGSAYFKSTDGHMGQWAFSLRRLNLQVLDFVAERGGVVLVDSTRRGKSMPDALSKTVPVWCAVVNRVVFGEGRVYVPPGVVGGSERAQMEGRVGGFVEAFLDICKPNVAELRAKLQKPLRPIWVTQESSLPDSPPEFPDFHPIVLCTASRRVQGAEISEAGYIQGAADDHEAWAHGLTPALFWKYKDQLMSTSEDDAPALIAKLISEEDAGIATATLIKPTKNLYISSSGNVDLAPFDVVVSCSPVPFSPDNLKQAGIRHSLHLKCQTGKLGSRDLRTQLPQLLSFAGSLPPPLPETKILVCCPTGKDLSVGAALAILCLYMHDEGEINWHVQREARHINKDFIKQRLSWITTSNPALNPSRSTLQSVNAVLLASHDPKASPPSNPTPPTFTDTLAIRETRPIPQDPFPQQDPQPATLFHTLPTHPWAFTRTLRSALPTHPSGTVTGTATFTPCALPPSSPPTLLYAEQGAFTTTTGLTFGVRRKYVYQLTSDTDTGAPYITVRFFDDAGMSREDGAGVGERGEAVGGLFVEMGALAGVDGDGDGDGDVVLQAGNREQHLCGEDLYTARWRVGGGLVGGKGGAWWEVRYDAKGPRKDYVSETRYVREEKGIVE